MKKHSTPRFARPARAGRPSTGSAATLAPRKEDSTDMQNAPNANRSHTPHPKATPGTPVLVFVVPAYKESPHLDACLWSLRQQTVPCRILITTSTPNDHIDLVAKKHGVPVFANPKGGSIAADWNFALEKAGTGLVTLAHQDDLYNEHYAEACLAALRRNPDMVMAFTDYAEVLGEGGVIRGNTAMLIIKRMLLFPFLFRSAIRSRFIRKAVLRLGSPVCCPSVCLNRAVVPDFRFQSEYTVNMDWDAWLRLADVRGATVHIRERYCLHRIHGGSETSSGIRDNRRAEEDLRIFRRLWPKPIADLLAKVYALSYQSNNTAEGASRNAAEKQGA